MIEPQVSDLRLVCCLDLSSALTGKVRRGGDRFVSLGASRALSF
jgi:hypothetical protein